MGQSVHHGRAARRRDGQVHARREHQGDHRRRPRRRARARASGAAWPSGAARRSATTRTRRSRRPPSSTFDGERYSVPGDYAEVEADGTLTLLGPRLGVHQHRRREGVPRGGRGGAQDPPRRRRRGRGRRPRREVRRGHHRRGRGRARRSRSTRPALDRPREGQARAYKAPKRVLAVDTIGRAPNGKVDYKRLQGRGRREPADGRSRAGGGTRNRRRRTSVDAHEGRPPPTSGGHPHHAQPGAQRRRPSRRPRAQAGWAAPAADAASAPLGVGPDDRRALVALRPVPADHRGHDRSGAYTATGVLLALLLVGGVVGWLTVEREPHGRRQLPGLAAAADVRGARRGHPPGLQAQARHVPRAGLRPAPGRRARCHLPRVRGPVGRHRPAGRRHHRGRHRR